MMLGAQDYLFLLNGQWLIVFKTVVKGYELSSTVCWSNIATIGYCVKLKKIITQLGI